jgi:mannan endo-1,4-beta-mannosidase
MKAAGMKVLRTWVTGHAAGQKGSDSREVPDLEHNGLGTYDDTILNQLDQLMVSSKGSMLMQYQLYSLYDSFSY